MERVDSLGDGVLMKRLVVMNAFYRRRYRLDKQERIAVRMYWGIKTNKRCYVYREVAEKLGCSASKASFLVHRALRKLEFAWPSRETPPGEKVAERIHAKRTSAIDTALCLALDLPLIQPVFEIIPYAMNRQLNKLQRWIIYLRFFCGHSIAESAALSNITAKKVYRTETEALRRIRRYVVPRIGGTGFGEQQEIQNEVRNFLEPIIAQAKQRQSK